MNEIRRDALKNRIQMGNKTSDIKLNLKGNRDMKASRISKKQVKDVQKIKDACIKIRSQNPGYTDEEVLRLAFIRVKGTKIGLRAFQMVWKNPDKYDFLANPMENEVDALDSIEKIKKNIKNDGKESEDELKNNSEEDC